MYEDLIQRLMQFKATLNMMFGKHPDADLVEEAADALREAQAALEEATSKTTSKRTAKAAAAEA